MVSDDVVYGSVLVLSIPFGLLVKNLKSGIQKQCLTSLLGLLILILACGRDVTHTFITIFVNCLLVKVLSWRWCHVASFVWCFGYLAFFRTVHWFGLPYPSPVANAAQLFLTLKMIGLAFEVHDTNRQRAENAQDNDAALVKRFRQVNPSILDIFAYGYCYIGLLTGPYYKYRTYQDFIEEKHGDCIPVKDAALKLLKPIPVIAASFLLFSSYFNIGYVETDDFESQPFWFRLFYMTPMFIIFRTRLYMAWLMAEVGAITAGLGAYPAHSNPRCGMGPRDLHALAEEKAKNPGMVEYNFETVHNLDIWGCELAPTTREGLRSWNMTVQYWLAAHVHQRFPMKNFRVAATMTVSAFWHGIHPGYYLSFLTVPPILMAEEAMINAFRKHATPEGQRLFDWGCWFFKMRGFDYNCMGFLLLRLGSTLKYWYSIYFLAHVMVVVFLLIARLAPRRRRAAAESNTNASATKAE